MASSKTFNLTLTNKTHTHLALTTPSSNTPTYTAELGWLTPELFSTPKKHSVTLFSPSSSTTNGVVDFPFTSLSAPIQLYYGDPSSLKPISEWQTIHCRDPLLVNIFELTLDLGPGKGNVENDPRGRRVFDWKRTHVVDGLGKLRRELDFLHLKMVDRQTKQVVARFKHHLWCGSKRGVLEVEEWDGGEEWERKVVLSFLAVLEYSRKIGGWSL